MINQALSLASPSQRQILDDNYGKKNAECEGRVKQVFRELDLEAVYRRYEEESYVKLKGLIDGVDESLLPKGMFLRFMERIYKRTK